VKTYTVRMFLKGGDCFVFRSYDASHAVATLCPSGYGYKGIYKLLTISHEQSEADAFWEGLLLREAVPGIESKNKKESRL
jgi:hypothetical protein